MTDTPAEALDVLSALEELLDVLDQHPEAYRLDSGEHGQAYVEALVRARGVRLAHRKPTQDT